MYGGKKGTENGNKRCRENFLAAASRVIFIKAELKGEVGTINDRNIRERRSCMKNNGKSPIFKFVSGEERRSWEVQRVSWGWRLPGATHSSAESHLDPKMSGNSGSGAVRAGKRRP